MKTIRVSGLIVCALLVGTLAAEGTTTVTVQQTIDYRSNNWTNGPWFIEPEMILDHSPFCRTSNEDWGWIHNVAALVPATAIGIESATLTIVAWKVDAEQGEDDVIYVTLEKPPEPVTTNVRRIGTKLGELKSYLMSPTTVSWPAAGQPGGYQDFWSVTVFQLPSNVLDDLDEFRQLYVHMDIDQYDPDGYRVTLKHATLTIKYITTGTPPPQPPGDTTAPVYRFWSPLYGKHFFTIDPNEKDNVIATYPPEIWTYESIAFRAYPADSQATGTKAVHRFWSPLLASHFYTIDAAEKDYIVANYPPEVWTYQGVAFYAYADNGAQPVDSSPVHRFWSPLFGGHFYTIDTAEKDYILANYPLEIWSYENIAFHAFMP